MNHEVTAGIKSNDDYFSRFGIDETKIQQVISVALARGGDFCDLYFQHTTSNFLGLEDNEVNRAYSNIESGVGIRVLKDDQTGFSFSEDLSLRSLKRAAKTAAEIASGSKNVPPVEMKQGKVGNYYPTQVPWENVGIEQKIPLLEQVNAMIFRQDARIKKSRLSFYDNISYVMIATSEGLIQCDYRPMTGLSVNCMAEQNGRRESNGHNLSARQDFSFFTPERLKEVADESVRRTVILFEASKPQPGEMEVVLAAGSSGILLHEAIGHGMEADFNRKNLSIYADKLNQPVARNFVSVVDDGTNLNVRGSLNVDDEGNPSQKTVLVENGILRSYLHDRISAQHYKVAPTGNGRRESFRFAPLPRMRNTYMLPGPHKKEEIIQSVNKGIYAETFSNGQVFIGAGDFTFYVKFGYLIENGKLTRPIKDVNIIGNGPKVLENVVMVADDFKMNEGGSVCGKDGQGVPVSMGLPTVKVSSITVGGVS